MTWYEAARDAMAAAKLCNREAHFRSAISRSYYAMYLAVTGAALAEGLDPPSGRHSWNHAKTQDLVRSSLRKALGPKARKEVSRMLWYAYNQRVVADYLPGRTVDSRDARHCICYAIAVLRKLGVLE